MVGNVSGEQISGNETRNNIVDKDEKSSANKKNYDTNRFYVSLVMDSWEGARKRCQAMGEDLATISSIAELRSLKEYLKKRFPKIPYWIGAKKTDLKIPGNWKWITGEPIPTNGEVGNWSLGDLNRIYDTRYIKSRCLLIHNQPIQYPNLDLSSRSCYTDDLPFVCSMKN